MEWIKITDRRPKEGILFLGAGMTNNRGYQIRLCYLDNSGCCHDVLMEAAARIVVEPEERQSATLELPWERDFRLNDFVHGIYPDWWMPLPSTAGLDNYKESPSTEAERRQYTEYLDYMMLRNIEKEMNQKDI